MLKQYSFSVLPSISALPNSDQSTCACTPGFVSYLSVAATPCSGLDSRIKSLTIVYFPLYPISFTSRNSREAVKGASLSFFMMNCLYGSSLLSFFTRSFVSGIELLFKCVRIVFLSWPVFLDIWLIFSP